MNKKLIELIREEFYKRIRVKTGWGYKEVIKEFERAILDACVLYLDNIEDKDSGYKKIGPMQMDIEK
jgi:hypothetical protein